MTIIPRENRSPWYYASLQRLQRLQCREPAGPIEAKCHEQPLQSRRRRLREGRRTSRRQRACAEAPCTRPRTAPCSTTCPPASYRTATHAALRTTIVPMGGAAVRLSIVLWDTPAPIIATRAAPMHHDVTHAASPTTPQATVAVLEGVPPPIAVPAVVPGLPVAPPPVGMSLRLRGAGRRRTPTPEPTQAQPVVDPSGVPADPNNGDCPPTHFGLGTICGALQMTYSLTHLTTDSNRPQGGTSVRHGAGLECLSDHGHEAAFSHLVNHSGCLPDEPRIVPELAHHPQIAAILRALDVGGVHSLPTRAPEADQRRPRPAALPTCSIAAIVHTKWADPICIGRPSADPDYPVVAARSDVRYAVEEGDTPLHRTAELYVICKALAEALVTSTALEKLLLLPLLYPGYAHAHLPFPNHPKRFLGLDVIGEGFRRVLLIPPVGPEGWLNRLRGMAKAFHITFEYAAVSHRRTTVSFGCKRSLFSFEQDAVRPLLLSDVEEYMLGLDSRIMMPRGGWCIEGYGPSYRARLEHAAFRIYCMALNALADDESLIGGIMRRCHTWRFSTPFHPYVPYMIPDSHLESTFDPTKIDLWIRHHVRQHLVIDCRGHDAPQTDGGSPIIVLQVEQDVLVIDDLLAAARSPLLRFVLNSPTIAKITGYSAAVQNTLATILDKADDWSVHWFDISEFTPFIADTSLIVLLDVVGSSHPISLTTEMMGCGTLWWERGPNRLDRDPLFVTALLSDLLYFLSNEEPRYLAAFEVGRPNPKAYPINKLDDYERFYRGGDRSPHHSRCECFHCKQRAPSAYHCNLDGTVSEFATPPPYNIRHDMCLCLCDRNFHTCTCNSRLSCTSFMRNVRRTSPAVLADDRTPPSVAPLTHRRCSLPTLVCGLNLHLDDTTSSGYRGVEWCDTSSRYLATLDSRPLGAFRTAVEAALRIARETATPHLITLNADVLEVILRFMPGVTVLYKSSRALRQALRPACYAIHLDRCLRDWFLRPKPDQPTSFDRHTPGNFERVEFATFSLPIAESTRCIHPALSIVAPADGVFAWASPNILSSRVSQRFLFDDARNPYLLTELSLDWINAFAPDWRIHIDTTPRRSSGNHEDVVGSILVAIRFVKYAGHIIVRALVRTRMRDHFHIGRDATHGNPISLCASSLPWQPCAHRQGRQPSPSAALCVHLLLMLERRCRPPQPRLRGDGRRPHDRTRHARNTHICHADHCYHSCPLALRHRHLPLPFV